MFVIMESFKRFDDKQRDGISLNEKVGYAMMQAGTAITMTSVTDILAFGAGAVTVT